ncbi:MAG: hypothetical protein JRN06_08480 [Nitrososphaerota archaeon]|nr:hypothetical protein [Nitrososphaerota archaeon]MDG7024180.1 hypothetical protein [Nitrososphaerota archaeon]
MNTGKVYRIASVLVKSQLRSGRSGTRSSRLFGNPLTVSAVDAVVFAGSMGMVYLVLGAVGSFPSDMEAIVDAITLQILTSLPAFVFLGVFLAAVLFEMGVSSKFASSDVVNWLPLSQAEYVAASTLSVCYMYSFLPALVLGVTYPFAARIGVQLAWGVAGALCLVSLFGVGALVEVMRAAINRVTSLAYGKARRGTMVIRLVVTVIVILAVEVGFNPVILSSLIGTFTGVVSAALFVPVFWPSASVGYLIQGEGLLSAAFFALSVLFAGVILAVAVKVRARYWSPVPVTIEVTGASYAPHAGGLLRSLGLSTVESAIVRKDLRGYTRRRELMPYLAIPFVFVALIFFQEASIGGNGSTDVGVAVYPFWLVGGILGVIMASTGIGQEGKAILNVYAAPIQPRALLKAKLLIAFVFGAATIVAMAAISSLLASATLDGFVVSLVASLVIALECTLIGVAVGVRYPDLQERPRPRFIRPMGMLIAMTLGVVSSFVTALPLVVWPFAGGYFEGLGVSFGTAVVGGLAFGGLVSFAAYRLALSGTSKLMEDMSI